MNKIEADTGLGRNQGRAFHRLKKKKRLLVTAVLLVLFAGGYYFRSFLFETAMERSR